IRRSFRSVVQVRTNERMAALLAAYTPKAAVPLTLATEPLRMIEPPSFSSGKAFCTVNSVPLTLMLNSLSKCSSVTVLKGTNSPTPALAKTISIRPFTFEMNPRNVGADCLHGLVEFLLAAARDEDIGTLFDEKLCRSQPNPFGPAGDDSGLAFELLGHCLSPLLLSWNSPGSDASRSIT